MKTLYIECGMGAAGDMLMAALLELCPDPDALVEKLNDLGIPKVTYRCEKSVKCGITGTHMSVLVDGREEESEDAHTHDVEGNSCGRHVHETTHESDGHMHNEESGSHAGHEHGQHNHHHGHHHTGLDEITHQITHFNLPEAVKRDAIAVYRLIAEAEGHVHDKQPEEIHFHEVGTLDAVADVVGVCYLMHVLGAEQIVTSPVHVGSGQVRCAHGILPVPAPAAAYLLRGVPIYSGDIKGELCTPTGAALLKYFSTDFGAMPVMRVEKIGYGMGKKDFAAANCVRVMLGEDS